MFAPARTKECHALLYGATLYQGVVSWKDDKGPKDLLRAGFLPYC